MITRPLEWHREFGDIAERSELAQSRVLWRARRTVRLGESSLDLLAPPSVHASVLVVLFLVVVLVVSLE